MSENTIEQPEYLYSSYWDDYADKVWIRRRIVKKTARFVYIARKSWDESQTIRVPREELEREGSAWGSGRRWAKDHWYLQPDEYEVWSWDQDRIRPQRKWVPQFLADLGLESGATPADVDRAYRRLALVKHPDAGGDHEAFLQLQRTYERAREFAERTVA